MRTSPREFQRLAVKAGLNGVMMGNFLTTLGSEPDWDRELFEELGLNVTRQDDNGSNPRPDNRSGWPSEGDTPRTLLDELVDSQDEANFWNPATQLRYRQEELGAAPARRGPEHVPRDRHRRSARGGCMSTEIDGRLHELRDRGLYRKLRCVSGPAGAARAPRRQAGAAPVLEQLPRPG